MNKISLVFIILILIPILIITYIFRNIVINNENNLTHNIDYYLNVIKTTTSKDQIKKNLSDIPIYVINLERSKSRKKFMQTQEKDYGLKFNYINAIDGKKIDTHSGFISFYGKVSTKYICKNNKNSSNYEVACTLSHLKAIKNVYENNHKYALILEDDVSFSVVSQWKYDINTIINKCPKDWDIISLYRNSYSHNPKNKKEYLNDIHYGMCSYIISHNGCKKILDKLFIKNTIVIYPVIQQLASDTLLKSIVNTYHYRYILFFPVNTNLDSTIHQDHTIDHLINTKNILMSYYDSLKYTEIPKILHIIWIGNKKHPNTLKTWTRDFHIFNPEWTVKIWNDKDILDLNLVNKKSYDEMKEYCGKADIARYEIIYRYGGMYIDADTMWLKNPYKDMTGGLVNLCYENKKLIMNGWFSSIPNHPFFKKIINEIPKRDLTQLPWLSVGPKLVTDVYNAIKKNMKINKSDINIVSIEKILCPTDWHNINSKDHDNYVKKCKASDAFAFHWGLSTNK